MSKTNHKGPVAALEKWFAAKQKVTVAFSGGVDSSLLLFIGSRVLGRNCLGLFAKSPLMACHQVTAAKDFAAHYKLAYNEAVFSPFQLPGFSKNKSDRCYICKKGLYANLKASLRPGWHLADGTNLDDDPAQRPGFQAIRELEVATPFLDCMIGKSEIREISRTLGLTTWDKPSDSCLATRIPKNIFISEQLLQKVNGIEAAMRQLGFSGIRAILQDDKVLLTFKEGDLERALIPEMAGNIKKMMKEYSFSKVFLDLSERQGILP